MRLKPFDEDDGYRVWLSDAELNDLIEELGNAKDNGTRKRLAGKFGGRVGLRREEASLVRPADRAEGPGGANLRVWEDQAKNGAYRETPVPRRLDREIEALAEVADIPPDEPVLGVTPKTLNRWVQRAAERSYADTGDEGWLELSFHDLRRTWGTRLLEQGVLPTVVMSWGGWKDWETFRRHYLGEFSPEAVKRERSKVKGLADGEDINININNSQNHLVPIGTTPRQRSTTD